MAKFGHSEDYYRLQRLSWSGYNAYRECPKRYKYRYVDRKRVPYNAYNALGGKTIQRVFELFYNRKIWRRGKETLPTLQELLPKEYETLCRKETVNWELAESRLTQEELLETLVPLIPSTLKVVKENRLLGKYAKSEVKLQAWVDKILVHGVADFVIRREDGHIILDGKLTKHRNKYLKVDQLVWYVMLFYLRHRVVVPRVGWIYYSYGELEWVPVTVADIKRLYKELNETIVLIKRNKFPATPGDVCRFCDFRKICEAGKAERLAKKVGAADRRQQRYVEAESPLAKPVKGVEEISF